RSRSRSCRRRRTRRSPRRCRRPRGGAPGWRGPRAVLAGWVVGSSIGSVSGDDRGDRVAFSDPMATGLAGGIPVGGALGGLSEVFGGRPDLGRQGGEGVEIELVHVGGGQAEHGA